MTPAEVEAYVRTSAAHGLSRAAVRDVLGLSPYRFARLLGTLEGVQWPRPGHSLDNHRHYESMKGNGGAHLSAASLKGGETMRERFSHTVRDCHGTLPQLIKHFGLSVTDSTVLKRMAKGADLETALFTPAGQFRPPQRTPQE
ncbi:hypothetical protein D3C76_798870 [compost metagenome]